MTRRQAALFVYLIRSEGWTLPIAAMSHERRLSLKVSEAPKTDTRFVPATRLSRIARAQRVNGHLERRKILTTAGGVGKSVALAGCIGRITLTRNRRTVTNYAG